MKYILCPDGHGRMQRMYARHSVGGINQWIITNYWYCPICKRAHEPSAEPSHMTKKLVVEIEDNGEVYLHGKDRLTKWEIDHIFKTLLRIHCQQNEDSNEIAIQRMHEK